MRKLINAIVVLALQLAVEAGELNIEVVDAPSVVLKPDEVATVLVARVTGGAGGGILNKFRVRFEGAATAFRSVELMDYGVTPPQAWGPKQPIVFDGAWLSTSLILPEGESYTIGVAVYAQNELRSYAEKTARIEIAEVDSGGDTLLVALPLQGGAITFSDTRPKLSIFREGEFFFLNGEGEPGITYSLLFSKDAERFNTTDLSVTADSAGHFQFQFSRAHFGNDRSYFQVVTLP